jgi:hypothetical protein
MKQAKRAWLRHSLWILTAPMIALAGGCTCLKQATSAPPAPELGPVGFLVRTNYRGWSDALLLSNGRVEAVIVPAIGRVMQFRFAGEKEGPFWENEALFGQTADPTSTNWANFGGDKTWPAPQADWDDHTRHSWPPPATFDAMAWEATVKGWKVTLTSAVDPDYGIRARREISLAIDDPVMHITTTYEKLSGRPMLVSVWIVTQLKQPILACAPLAVPSIYREGFKLQSEESPPSLRVENGVLSLARHPKQAHLIGLDGGTLFWLSDESVLRIDSSRLPHRKYPDEGASIKLYTNPDPLPYVELETLGPLEKMIIGTVIHRSSTYTLRRRAELDLGLEIRRLLPR